MLGLITNTTCTYTAHRVTVHVHACTCTFGYTAYIMNKGRILLYSSHVQLNKTKIKNVLKQCFGVNNNLLTTAKLISGRANISLKMAAMLSAGLIAVS